MSDFLLNSPFSSTFQYTVGKLILCVRCTSKSSDQNFYFLRGRVIWCGVWNGALQSFKLMALVSSLHHNLYLHRCNSCLSWYRCLCKVTSEMLTLAIELSLEHYGCCGLEKMQCWQLKSLQLIQLVYHYMGGKDSRCVVAHGICHVMSRMTLTDEVAMLK